MASRQGKLSTPYDTPGEPSPRTLPQDSSRNPNAQQQRQVAEGSGQLSFPTIGEQSDHPSGHSSQKKKRRQRGHKKRRNRRQSFAPAPDETGPEDNSASRPSTVERLTSRDTTAARPSFYKLGQSSGGPGNTSSTSLESEALLDHRDQLPMRPRRQSTLLSSFAMPRPSIQSPLDGASSSAFRQRPSRMRQSQQYSGSDDEDVAVDDRTPLIASGQDRPSSKDGYGGFFTRSRTASRDRPGSAATSTSSRRRKRLGTLPQHPSSTGLDYDVNNPPSVPSSPKLGTDMGYGDVMVTGDFNSRSPESKRGIGPLSRDAIVDMENESLVHSYPGSHPSNPSSPRGESPERRRHTVAVPGEVDVCFPMEGMSEIAEEDYTPPEPGFPYAPTTRRRRGRKWPDLSVLEEWSREEKEERSEGIRAKKISEPVLVDGRLRPQMSAWHRQQEDEPYRFTYFNEEFQSTVHSQTISELLQPGQTFRDLFIPDPPLLSDSSSDEEDDDLTSHQDHLSRMPSLSKPTTRQSSILGEQKPEGRDSSGQPTPAPETKPKRYGARPTFWLDVLSPTDAEMRVISKTFGIHPLTAEDIMMQEAREKVELFRHYYFVNYRTFEQDMSSDDYLNPVNMYVIVFREGVISFHFSMTPHPANVRRRIRQLKDYLILSSDWISYAIIDDITDVFAPLIQSIEREVDEIDDAILQLHNPDTPDEKLSAKMTPSSKLPVSKFKDVAASEKRSEAGDSTSGVSGGDMLRQVGDCRKKVMGLYRLLGNKADVIKGFAKRCNEQWEVAPRSEIGLYLGDIQDHIVTMTGNLTHYEMLLSRAHSNYLAQINIRMNERQEQTSDILGKLTVLGTIVLPMNIVTGMWGMNVMVPGQEIENLYWFWSITAALLVFGISCYFIAKRVYGIV
ncbi:cora-domain-containing protein [Xylona heveae TC161]|uniref:Cora-domain-containing protein n=1 Tax=Xylona heveae (strain CBS 132557 / TC161) TaxID=1328760 RepID=A0A165I871_XYLHT|nr:cora-domain-containing protein [Xylona heveae TC161]KZF24524.1 cora-domain-containing protein [Xylona heveae TC161]